MDEREICIVVYGKAKTQGSKRAFPHPKTGRILIVDDDPKTREWRHQVAQAAGEQYGGPLLEGPLVLTCTFYRPRPRNHYGTGRNSGVLKDKAPAAPIVAPDVSKQVRAVEDALADVLYRNDSQIVEQHARKLYGAPARVEIRVRSYKQAPFLTAAVSEQQALAV